MTINFELLDAAIEDAANRRDGIVHNQSDWIDVVPGTEDDPEHPCGTAVCLAGFIGLRAGAVMPKPEYEPDWGWTFPSWDVNPETGAYMSSWRGSVPIRYFARDRAGITDSQATALFRAANSLAAIRRMVDHLRLDPDAGYTGLMVAAYGKADPDA